MNLRFLFPCLPYSPSQVEPMFESQREAAGKLGFKTSLLSYEDLLQEERLIVRPPAESDEVLLLRGWMLKADEYASLHSLSSRRGWQLLISPQHYERCHFLPGWVGQLEDLTPPTVALDWRDRGRIEHLLQSWGCAFVKDSVKSCTLGGPPIVRDFDELVALKGRMDEYRGYPESLLYFRRVEEFQSDRERRLFVIRGQVHHFDAPEAALTLGRQVAERIDSPFYSVDVVVRRDGVWRVVELGDGQVSDLKEWTPERLFLLFT